MKLKIREEFYDAILHGYKNLEFRDAHITFVCEKTGREIKKYIKDVSIVEYNDLPESIQLANKRNNMFDDNNIIRFEFE